MTDQLIPRPVFDHCYRSIEGDSVYKELQERGFLLNPEPIIHPGRLKCQFLHFRSPVDKFSYLEFLFRDGTLQPAGPEEELIHAGFALKIDRNLDEVFSVFKRDFDWLKPKFEHRNYDRAADESQRLPGWNFLTFEQQPIDDIEVWIIEYEQRLSLAEEELKERRRRALALCDHPNSARYILGFIWDGRQSKDFDNFAKLSFAKSSNASLRLEGGTSIRIVQEGATERRYFRDKTGTFLAVVIGVESLDSFVREANPDDMVEVFGMKGARIRLGRDSWDIVAVESRSF
ncbi:MAG TPA: hypothetical protein VFO10_28450 [Oligoflexus sp.]|uniref:hypothetical protein n=1 Tax=Oligoflexus sp. TaxID=1971216 RepID=UPI002D7F264B|nr:hypothetical protein [Oligoflexus sp.]HET9241229.1 hypothetical protein [Oligoflexus sp.]